MPWYYAENGQQQGPLTDEQFQSAVQAGTVRADTLVWRDGMGNWQPYSTVAGAAAPAAAGAAPTAAGGVFCSECGKSFPPDQVISISGRNVCAACKPVFVQRLSEGATIAVAPGEMRYAGFWIRFAAKFIDGLIVGVPTFLLIFLTGGLMGASGAVNPNSPAAAMSMLGVQIGAQLVSIAIGAAYTIFFVAKYAATPGKMAVGLKVVNADGSKVSAGKATGRYFAEMLSGITCYIGYIIAGFDGQKRSLHDHVCGTRVIYK